MPFLTDTDKRRIEAAVAAAEGRTAAEFVTVVARRSGHYLYLPTLAAAAALLLLSGVALIVPWPVTVTVGHFYFGQVLGFIVLYLFFCWWPIRRRIVPKHIQCERARLHAHELFLDLGLATTRDRTGVMLFVSEAEHYVEIIADRGAREAVDDEVWQTTVAQFAADVRRGRTADGFLGAIETCTAVLEARLPPRPGDTDELPNRLIEL
jgi:putative membrane protein